MKLYIALFCLCVFLCSCNDTITTPPSTPEKPSAIDLIALGQQLDSFAIYHNQALAVVYDSIVTGFIPVTSSGLGPNWDLKARTVIQVFFNTHYGYSSMVMNTIDSSFIDNMVSSSSSAADTSSLLSPAAKLIVSDLKTLVNDYSSSSIGLSSFLTGCDSLKQRCLNLNDSLQALVCGSAVMTARGSAQYWNAHASDWNQYLPQAMSKRDKQILDADWKGAVVGLFTGSGPVGAYFGGCYSSLFEGIGIGFGWW